MASLAMIGERALPAILELAASRDATGVERVAAGAVFRQVVKTQASFGINLRGLLGFMRVNLIVPLSVKGIAF